MPVLPATLHLGNKHSGNSSTYSWGNNKSRKRRSRSGKMRRKVTLKATVFNGFINNKPSSRRTLVENGFIAQSCEQLLNNGAQSLPSSPLGGNMSNNNTTNGSRNSLLASPQNNSKNTRSPMFSGINGGGKTMIGSSSKMQRKIERRFGVMVS